MKRFPLQILATVCLPLFVVGCPDDAPSDEEVGATDTSTDESTTDDEADVTTTDDEAEVTTDESTTDESTTDESTTDESTTDESTTDESTETATETETATDTGGVCGDMIIDGGEDCEGLDLAGADCVSVGFMGGDLLCGADCLFDTSGCFNAECGNGVIEGNEECDTDDLGGLTCADEGFVGGELACSDVCTLVTDACSNCGNDAIDAPEVCDGTDLGGQTCVDLGYAGGEVSCNASCDAVVEDGCVDIILCNDTDTAIPDNNVNGVTIPIVVPDMGTVADIDISVDITHSWLADLDVSLNRDGMSSTFMFRDIANMGGGVGSCSGNNMIATLDDGAATSIQTQACVNANIPAVDGTYQPEQVLSVFNAGASAATWNLRLIDDAGSDLGTVNQWCVYITLE